MGYDTKSLRASLWTPTTSLSGNEAPSMFRGENLVLRGARGGNPYFEVFGGNEDLGEDYDLTSGHLITGTLSFTNTSTTVTGLATQFKSELHIGQHLLAGTQVLHVKEVVSDTQFIAGRIPATSEGSRKAYRLPQISEMDGKRCVMLTGNAIKLGKGHIIAVGSGTVYINGQPLAGTSLVASAKAKAAIYRPLTNDYVIQSLGYTATPPKPTVEVVAGGTKGMVDLNKHSFMISYWSGSPEGTNGYSNPCEPVKLDINGDPIQIDGANNRFLMDFTPSLVGMPPNAKGFVIWASQAGKKQKSVSGATVTITSPNETQYENGPWLRVAKVLTTDLAAGDTYTFEYLDTELYNEVTGGNIPPPGAEFVTLIDGRAVFVSCYGQGTTADGEGSNPGAFLSSGKADNPDGAPAEWLARTSSGTIVGLFEGVGRWFVTTSSGLEFAVPTGLYGQQSEQGAAIELPIITRPYWKTGASNRYSIALVDDTLYGRSGGKFFKSVGYGDENVKKYDFGSVMEDVTRDWTDGYVMVGNDPKNTQVCFFNTAAYKNADGYWVSEIYPYSLYDAWLPKIVLSSPTRDMIVSGVATVDEKLEFLCGGRVSDGTFEVKTYRFATGDADIATMPYYLIWQITDDGLENVSKRIHSIRPSGRFTSMNVQVHGALPGQPISVANMVAGDNTADPGAYFSGSIPFDDTTLPTRYLEKPVKIKNLSVYALRVAGVWDGMGIPDRLDELVIEISTHGRTR